MISRTLASNSAGIALGRSAAVAAALVGGVVALSAMVSESAPADSDIRSIATDQSAAVSYAEQVQPIFDAKCVTCHGGRYRGRDRLEGGLDLSTYEAVMKGSEFGTVVEAGDADASILYDMVEAGDMPEEGDALTPEELELVRAWITEGALNN